MKDINVAFNITFKNIEASDALKEYIEDKIGACIKKYLHHSVEVKVVLTVEKNRHTAEVVFNADGTTFSGKETSNDMYTSIDTLTSTLAEQLRRHKDKITAHR